MLVWFDSENLVLIFAFYYTDDNGGNIRYVVSQW